jgi:hypothetical protein
VQIGPKIRIGGTLGKIGQDIKEGAGKVAKAAAPVVSLFNPAIGAALGAAGTALDTSGGAVSLGDVLKNGGMAAIPGIAGKALGVLQNVPGAGSIADLIRGAGNTVSNLPGADAIGGALGKLGGLVPRNADGSPDWAKIAQLGAVAIPAIQGYSDAQAANRRAAQQYDVANKAQTAQLDYANGLLASAAPVRDASSAALLARIRGGAPAAPNLSGLLTAGSNPFGARYAPLVAPPRAA